ncbi:hypothetical protein H0H92_011827, partial [Tricholoma furcatifolium]
TEEIEQDWETSSHTVVGSAWSSDVEEDREDEVIEDVSDSSDIDMSSEPDLERSSTVWLDSDVESQVTRRPQRLNHQLMVDELETVTGLPLYWPVPRVKTAYLLDLSSDEHNIKDDNGNLLSVDALIKNKDQDSWTGGSGAADSKVSFSIFTGSPIKCRRSRLECAGFSACINVDPKLLETERWELDPSSLEDLVKLQVQDRIQEGNTAEKIALTFWAIIQGKICTARDEDGALCSGRPIMRARKRDSAAAKRKAHFIACSGWTRDWHDHWTSNIPDNVDEDLLSKLFLNKPLDSFSAPPSCSRLIPANVGGKAK